MVSRQPARLTTPEQIDRAQRLAKEYVDLDRLYFFNPENADDVKKTCERLRYALEDVDALITLRKLCEAGGYEEEILWLLSGCREKHVFVDTKEVFGLVPKRLNKVLGRVLDVANVVDSMKGTTFGILAEHVILGAGELGETLRDYAALATGAKISFGHRTEWFLNVAKARLVIHVQARTKRLNDQQVAVLVGAVLGTDYDAVAHAKWRRKYAFLVGTSYIDSIAAMNKSERKKARATWVRIATHPEFVEQVRRHTSQFQFLAHVRDRANRNALGRERSKSNR